LPEFSQRRLRQAHRRAAVSRVRADFMHRQLREELLARLDYVAINPALILDLGAGGGEACPALAQRYPDARLLAVDHAPAAWQDDAPASLLCADAQQLPFPDNSVDLVFCNLLLAYCRNPVPVLTEVARVLREPGLFLFSTLGPDSFNQWRQAWATVDTHTHVVPFPDMHDLGDLVVRAGLAEPVLDRDSFTVTYTRPEDFVADLRAVGSVNWSKTRQASLTGRGAWARLQAAVAAQREADNPWPVSLEVIWGQAWAGGAKGSAGGTDTEIPLTAIRPRRPTQGFDPS